RVLAAAELEAAMLNTQRTVAGRNVRYLDVVQNRVGTEHTGVRIVEDVSSVPRRHKELNLRAVRAVVIAVDTAGRVQDLQHFLRQFVVILQNRLRVRLEGHAILSELGRNIAGPNGRQGRLGLDDVALHRQRGGQYQIHRDHIRQQKAQLVG